MQIISALVCTRNRSASLVRTVRSLLADDSEAFELIIIDQSDGSDSETALAVFGADPRLRYVRTQARGKGAGLNEGLRLARGAIVACTDDDCEGPPRWAAEMARVLEGQPSAAILFCNVIACEHDRRAGYVPAYERHSDRLLRSVAAARHGIGLGAGMAVRRQAVLSMGGVDETFGPGSRFASGDDWDIALRALLSGWHVYDTASLSVLHHGFRTFAEGRTHARRDWLAIGAICAKPVRAGHPSGLILALWYFVGQALWPPIRDVLRLRRPSGGARIAGFATGFTRGLLTPVDRKTIRFQPAA